MSQPVLELREIAKEYESNRVLKGVSLAVRPGTIHALVGENGAGKSTLMNVLFGMPVIRDTGGYRGAVVIEGRERRFDSPADAMAAGIGMVHQEFMLLPGFSVAENIKLNREPTRANALSRLAGDLLATVDRDRAGADARAALDRVGLGVDEWLPVAGLPVGHMQFIEIAREVDKRGAKLLIFDEPTSVLAPHEAEGLFKIFDSLRQSGYTIIFISHKLNEVLASCDAITVLRQGRVVGSLPRAQATEQKLVSLIVGSKAFDSRAYARKLVAADAPTVIEMHAVEAFDDRGRQALHGVDLHIQAGEIVGVAGVSGNGQKELGEVIQGVRPISAGSLLIGGVSTEGQSVAQRRAAGVACIPEDPLLMGAVRIMTVEENLALGDSSGASRGWQPMDWPAARAKAAWLTDRFQLKMPRLHLLIEKLSGGNVQRIVCAREMSMQPKLLLAYYPTRGMDINAAETIRTALLAARDEGAAILIVSEDLDELVGISDRIIVMFHGQNVGECRPEAADIHEIGFLMTDGKRKAA